MATGLAEPLALRRLAEYTPDPKKPRAANIAFRTLGGSYGAWHFAIILAFYKQGAALRPHLARELLLGTNANPLKQHARLHTNRKESQRLGRTCCPGFQSGDPKQQVKSLICLINDL